MATFLQRYKRFVRRHRALLSAIEQGAATLTWLVPGGSEGGRFSSDVMAEAASSVVGVVGTINDHLVGENSDDEEHERLGESADEDEEEEEEEAAASEHGSSSFGSCDSFDGQTAGGARGDGEGALRRRSSKRRVRRADRREKDEDEGEGGASTSSSPSSFFSSKSKSAGGSTPPRATWEERACAFVEAVPLPLCLSLLSQVEVLSEMLAQRRYGDDDKMGAVVALETIKAAMKTALWAQQRGKLLVDDGLSAEQLGDEDGKEEGAGSNLSRSAGGGPDGPTGDDADRADGSVGGFGGDAMRSVPPGERRAALALNALYQFRLKVHQYREDLAVANVTGFRDASEDIDEHGTEAEASAIGAGGAGIDAGVERSDGSLAVPRHMRAPPPPPLGLTLRDVLARDRARLTLKLTGEMIHILRPLAYAASQRKFGRKSWRPLLVSASMDALSFACLGAAAGQNEREFSPNERVEMARRRAFLLYYLMRSPVFDKLTLSVLDGVGMALRPVPLVGGLYGKAVDIAEDVNDFFTYTY